MPGKTQFCDKYFESQVRASSANHFCSATCGFPPCDMLGVTVSISEKVIVLVSEWWVQCDPLSEKANTRNLISIKPIQSHRESLSG